MLDDIENNAYPGYEPNTAITDATVFKLGQKCEEYIQLAKTRLNTEMWDKIVQARVDAKKKKLGRCHRQVCLVWTGGSIQDFHNFVEESYSLAPFSLKDPHVKVAIKDSLQDAVNACLPGDAIILCEGDHVLEDLVDLKSDLTLIGTAKPYSKLINWEKN